MRLRGTSIATLCAAIVALSTHAAAVEGPKSCIGLAAGSALWLEGTSNVHDFEARSEAVRVTFACDPADAPPATAADLETAVRDSRVRALNVEVPVTTLHSGKNGLDKNMWQDLKADAQPNIALEVKRTTVKPRGADTLEVEAEGVLRIAGREKPVTLSARAMKDARGLLLDGHTALRMTEFGIKPRTMMLGTLRVRDEVTIRYHLWLVPAGATGATRTQ